MDRDANMDADKNKFTNYYFILSIEEQVSKHQP